MFAIAAHTSQITYHIQECSSIKRQSKNQLLIEQLFVFRLSNSIHSSILY